MGGEKFFKTIIFGCSLGSPPRGRGKDPAHQRGRHRPGIIPAWAGKRAFFHDSGRMPRDHPRVGGEKLTVMKPCVFCAGSPPRGRGKVHQHKAFRRRPGITPAWAGKSCAELLLEKVDEDHPRVGGEKRAAPPCRGVRGGSPPRGRGKARPTSMNGWPARITPAWAGKSPGDDARAARRGDHPRVGGEKLQPFVKNGYLKGSPPRGRGKAAFGTDEAVDLRITPAWAGKSLRPSCRGSRSRDHPRVGGEKSTSSLFPPPLIGSPPRGRGKGNALLHAPAQCGITPAWAGKRIRTATTARRLRDHPRVGGEKIIFPNARMVNAGSPPRGRGKARLLK